jgi:hypothetical protein
LGAVTKLHVLTAELQGRDIVKLLEDCLAEAREGTFSSIAVAIVERDGCTRAAWSNAPSYGLLIGAVARLQHDIIEAGS